MVPKDPIYPREPGFYSRDNRFFSELRFSRKPIPDTSPSQIISYPLVSFTVQNIN